MQKEELRKLYLEKRRDVSPGERDVMSEAITALFFESFDLSSMSFIHCFLPIRKFAEVDTNPIFERVWREFPQIETVAPRVNFAQGALEHLRFASATSLCENEWNITEPVSDEFVDAAQLDLVIVPLLAFDGRGFRVGYGKGFYDRFLQTCRPNCQKVGISFFPPVAVIHDVNENDVRLDCCLTPDSLIKF